MKYTMMNNLKFIEATNESHPRPARPASIPLTREAEAIGDPTLILAASGGLMEADTVRGGSMEADPVGGERTQK
jgi:hypothetical protein